MADIIYVVEDEWNGGDLRAFWKKEDAIQYVGELYCNTHFADGYQSIMEAFNNHNTEEFKIDLDAIEEDLTTLFKYGYIDSVAYIRTLELT